MITDNEELPKEQDIEELEKSLGYRLPAPYREYLLKYNGGIPVDEKKFWRDEARGIGLYLQHAFELVDDEPNLLSQREEFPDDRLPDYLLPICLDGGGSYVLLNLKSGEVLLWDYETHMDEEPQVLARDFDAFIAGCTGREGT